MRLWERFAKIHETFGEDLWGFARTLGETLGEDLQGLHEDS